MAFPVSCRICTRKFPDKLYFCTDEFFSNLYHGASAFFADLFAFIYGVKYFAVWKVFDQFFALAGIFSFAEMFFNFNQFWFFCIGVCKIFRLIKKRHLSLNIKGGCLFRLCSIKFTGQEINLLLQEPDLLFQFFDLILVLLFPV